MLQFTSLSLRRGPRLLFENTSFQIHPGQKAGLTGANGTGKSSLFALIMDELHADSGDCLVPRDWVIAHVAQETPADERAAIDYVLDGDHELRQIETELANAEKNGDGMQLASLHTRYDNIHGYSARSRAGQLLHGLGFKPGEETRAVNEYSGGWRMRLNLARALMCRSDLLLLDEPTNHLDLDAVIWLESWLRSYPGTLLLISHDRDFLDSVTTHIAHIEHQNITLYPGNYSAFERIRAERLANQQAQYSKQQREIAHIQSYVERFRAKATKARQAQSRIKALERMQVIVAAHVDSPFHFALREPEKRPHTLIKLESASAGYADKRILDDIDLNIAPGDRIGLLGPNGAGKSTLIKLIAGSLALQNGHREQHKDTRIGYFAQHQLEQLHPEHTPVEHLQQLDKDAREADLRQHLGGFGFGNQQALAKVGPFSGGEKSRLVLAMLVYQRPNLLLLDEPTNHLDLEMRQALALALQDFTGAMVIVSHDRHLLRVTCDRLLLVHDQRVEEFDGSLDEYPKWLSDHNKSRSIAGDNGAVTTPASTPVIAKKDRKRAEAEQRKQLQPLRKKVTKLEAQLDKLHARQKALETTLADPGIYAEQRKSELQKLLREKADLDGLCSQTEDEWMTASEALDASINNLKI
ncbi:MAG: ATP-binding cassette domain-containing protein [Gammaproteobacteria bacterium]